MPARIIDGKALAQQYRREIAARVAALGLRGKQVRLDAILADTGDSAARVYAENQGRTCAELGIVYRLHEFRTDADFDHIAGRILLLNTRDDVTAIMVHVPLPAGIEPFRIQRLIAPEKDVEGVNPANIGNIVYGQSSLVPCTALATIKMIESVGSPAGSVPRHTQGATDGSQRLAGRPPHPSIFRGRRAVVVGAGDVVGKPIAVLLMRQEATVTSCNKYTPDLATITRSAHILVAAAGVPRLINADMVRPGAIVVDVGVNRVPDPANPERMKTVGDVDFEPVRDVLGSDGWISPVPGGVGPMTVAMLLLNVVEAAERNG